MPDPLTMSTAIVALRAFVRKPIQNILGPPSKEFGLLLQDYVRSVRFNRQIKILQRAHKRVMAAGLSTRHVKLNILVPLLEYCSLEEDNTITAKWVGLLASAASGLKVSQSYPGILADISPIEAKLLDLMYREQSMVMGEETWVLNYDRIPKLLKLSQYDFAVIISNLYRLGLCDTMGGYTRRVDTALVRLLAHEGICLTPLGSDFIIACQGPRPRSKRQKRRKK